MYKNLILFGDSGVGKSYIANQLVTDLGYNKFHTAYYVRKFLYKIILNTYLDPNFEIDKKLERQVFYQGRSIQELLIDSVKIIHENEQNQKTFNDLNLVHLNNYYNESPLVIPGIRIKNNYKLFKSVWGANCLNVLIVNDKNEKTKELYDSDIKDVIGSDSYLTLDNTNFLNKKNIVKYFTINCKNEMIYKNVKKTNFLEKYSLENCLNNILLKELLYYI